MSVRVAYAENVAMCEALGLDPAKVRSIVLRFEPGRVATAEVEFIDIDDSGQITNLMSTFELKAKTPCAS